MRNGIYIIISVLGVSCTPSKPPTLNPSAPEAAPGREGLQVVREFTCVPPASSADDVLFVIDGRPEESVAIRPSGGNCQFELVLKRSSSDVLLTQKPGGYLVGVSTGAPGRGAVCVSNIIHGLDTAAPNVALADKAHRIERVTLECAVEWSDNEWTSLSTIVEGSNDFAAWPSYVAFNEETKQFKVGWVRDFSFQFLNISDRGRPSSDGLYETVFSVLQQRVTPVSTTKLADTVASDSSVTVGGAP